MATPAKRAYFTVKKIIAIVLILFFMYAFIGFFFWVYVTDPTITTEGSTEIFGYIQPVIDFFRPVTDFCTMVRDSLYGSGNPA